MAALLLSLTLSGGRVRAAVQVQQLSPSVSSPQPVGTTVVWTASATDTSSGDLVYRFSVQPPSGDFAVVRDFAASNSFEWTPGDREGAFNIRVSVKNTSTHEEVQLTAGYTVSPRVNGDSPVISGVASNPLVALYSAPPCEAGSMRVRFWRTGVFSSSVTSWKPCRPGVSMNFYVAGMLADTQYSMRHEVSSDPEAPVTTGPTLPFLTGAPPGVPLPSISVLTPSGGDTGQDVLLNGPLGFPAFPVPLNATDLGGSLLWYYPRQTFLILRPVEGGTIYVLPYGLWQDTLREIDLAGNTVRETNIEAVSGQLLARGEQAITSFHHDAGRLPDGNTVVLATVERTLSDVQGPGPVTILGDMILVLDKDWQVVWSWNSFDHLDVTRKAVLNERCARQPGCATTAASANDWLHSNSVTYSPADGNLLLSIRHQDWVVKIDYRDGSGTGDVVWRLGKDGDFTTDSTDPYPWFSHQHDAEYEADGTLTVYDNGNTRRQFPNATANSRGQALTIDEANREVTFNLNADLGSYSAALGSAQKLKNGGYHFLSGFLGNIGARSIEVDPDGASGFTLQAGISTYRTFRMRDLYTSGTSQSADGGVDQTVSFEAVAEHVYGDAPFTPSATASSGLPVTFRVVSGPATLSGNVVTVNGVGAVVLQADQYGNTKYNEAPSVRRTFAVAKADQSIAFGALPDKTFGDAPFSVSATGGGSGNPVTFSATGDCTSGGANGGTITITGAGSCTITASQAGNDNYNAAADVARAFDTRRATATITLHDLSQTYDGMAKTATATTSPSGLGTVSVSYKRNGAGVAAPTAAGSYDVTASLSNPNYTAADATGTLIIGKAGQTITFGALPNRTVGDAPFAVSATGGASGKPVTFSAGGDCSSGGANGGTITVTGAGSCSVTASQAGDSNYIAAPDVVRSFNINKRSQTITFGALSDKTFGDADFTLSATASSGLAVSFQVTGGCTISGSTIHLARAGSCSVNASQDGNNTYAAAAEVQRSFQVAKAGSTTTVTVSNATYDGNPHGGTAAVTGFGGLSRSLTVTYAGRNATAYGPSTTAPTNAGDYTASASFAGDTDHNGSGDSEDYSITKANQTITFNAIPNKTFGDAPFTVSAAGGASGNAITFSSQTLSVCSVSGSTVAILGAGTCTVRAAQAGNNNYADAPDVDRPFQIAKAATTTTLTSSANPAGVGQGVAYTATVTSANVRPDGVVRFFADGSLYGPTGVLCEPGVGYSCTAELRATPLPAGHHAITAEYLGNTNFPGSTGTLNGGQTIVAGGVFEFTQTTYAVAERGGSVTVRVLRQGDASLPATVDYATEDGSNPSVFVPCSATTGLALDRCDYERAHGTLSFAVGQREQTFTVLVNDDSYVEGPETALLRLSNPAGGAALAPVSTATLEITSDAAESVGNSLDDDEAFVRQHYRDFLNREPDADGLKFWTDGIKSCGLNQQCREVARINTSAAFFLSIEFQETGVLVYRMNKAAYSNLAGKPVPVSLLDYLRGTQQIGLGVVVGAAGWEQRLAESQTAFALSFVRRPEFLARYPVSMSAADFVNSLDANAGGVLTEAEKSALVTSLTPSPADAALRASVLREVAENPAFANAETNRAFVLMQYFGYLRRDPDASPNTNFDGYNFWLGKLEEFNGSYVQAEMVKAFINSVEYRQRFGQ